MEYEICDEERLFDESTNPSLQHGPRRPARSVTPQRDPPRPAGRRQDGPVPEEALSPQMG